ncbi:hypothetical protein BLL52_1165 [Rhodoferax antarcticus ANT.BR]|uniref:Uncharacterized protein n=1 Tax=Rhodoferax antarcticus ANT.BR TaxID=1111071 RepID=A0A1Q8YH67_9BURK|nr:hypothetical protein BLL52_1165 [Rhodoferax antarcticus ANT.BR]
MCSELPIEINGTSGLTRNVSATGVYFETTVAKAPGSKVQFVVQVMVKGELLKMVCSGEVVRVEHKVGTVGIAVKLCSSFFTDTNSCEELSASADD